MPDYSVKMKFRQLGYRWGFILYDIGDSASAVAEAWSPGGGTATAQIVPKFMRLLASNTTFYGLSVANLVPNRLDTANPGWIADGRGGPSTVNSVTVYDSPDVVNTSILLSLSGESGGSVKRHVRGVPDKYVQRDAGQGRDNPPPELLERIQDWMDTLEQASVYVRTKQAPVFGQSTYDYRVIQITPVADTDNLRSRMWLDTSAELFQARERVLFTGIRKQLVELLPYQGTFEVRGAGVGEVSGVAAAYVDVDAQYLSGSVKILPEFLRMRGAEYQLQTIRNLPAFAGYSTHQTGVSGPKGKRTGYSYRRPAGALA